MTEISGVLCRTTDLFLLHKSPCPVVICPYLCTSESCLHKHSCHSSDLAHTHTHTEGQYILRHAIVVCSYPSTHNIIQNPERRDAHSSTQMHSCVDTNVPLCNPTDRAVLFRGWRTNTFAPFTDNGAPFSSSERPKCGVRGFHSSPVSYFARAARDWTHAGLQRRGHFTCQNYSLRKSPRISATRSNTSTQMCRQMSKAWLAKFQTCHRSNRNPRPQPQVFSRLVFLTCCSLYCVFLTGYLGLQLGSGVPISLVNYTCAPRLRKGPENAGSLS